MLLAYLIEHNRYLNVLGIGVIIALACMFSKNRRAINLRLIAHALGLQFLIALVALKTPIGLAVLQAISAAVARVYQFADVGAAFIFGNLVDPTGPWGFIFAIKVLPVIIFFGALTSLFFYMGIIQVVVKGVNWLVQPLLGTTGAETLCAVANSFLGQTEAPLLVRNYLQHMSKSELLVVMVSGMGTISGSILVVFAAMGVPSMHLLTASVMAIPVTIMMAKILLPDERTKDTQEIEVSLVSPAGNMFDALALGTSDGLSLALNVAAMLISFAALIALLDAGLAYVSSYCCTTPITLQSLLGYLFVPFGWLLGFTGQVAYDVGSLLGIKVAANELFAYQRMMDMGLPERVVNVTTYALCGFSNFSCIGIQIGGIGALVPEKRQWLTQLGLYAVLGGALANVLSAMMVSLLL